MAISTITVAALGTVFLAGDKAFGPLSVPINAFAAQVRIAAAILVSPTLVLSARFELSQDAGATWDSCGSAGRSGDGVIPVDDKTGLPATEWWLRVSLHNPINVSRQIRGWLTVNEAISTFVNVIFET